ncbi:MAG TPA: protein translocase subunit SecF [Pyrinomonadaceae bacterium]|nr:protein translocase subunit SecF [Chloracidobacterium sp.]MBP9936092.1 protein translocase subunit SecF [Pyrinomonadaceae bacterium]MBK7803639.1 protein translocase subunit SecF [Chloracidobacterium sp.]MBK9439673.1 protein translocase subunit SecF [Chloracidobacterium sp.]MBL0239040.1 protein translocase subunit SecF [Chloracidobacterium sp.]
MLEIFKNINVDWMGLRKPLIFLSIAILFAGLFSAVGRQVSPGGTEAFNLGVDFQGGTVITAKFRNKPAEDDIRNALQGQNIADAVIQSSLDKQDEVLIKVPLFEGLSTEVPADGTNTTGANATQVNAGREMVKKALDTFGKEAEAGKRLADDEAAAYQIVGTDSVGPVAGAQLRNQAVIATLLGLVGILLYIAFRYDWTYAAGAVIAVFHDVLITLAFFSVFQWEISLTVLAALLTLVGFSVNDSIVIFDRIRENLTLDRNKPIYQLTNDSINQTMSRTIVTNGLVFLAVLALVLFGGEVLRGFSLALFVGSITGTYSTIAIASPIAIWWQGKIGNSRVKDVSIPQSGTEKMASASRRSVTRRPVTR